MNLSTQIHLPSLIGNRHAWTGSLRDIIYDDAAMCHWDEIARLHDLDPDEDDFDLADHADILTLEDVRKLADDPNAEVVGTLDHTILNHPATEGQAEIFDAAATIITSRGEYRYGEEADAMTADETTGAAMYALGDLTLTDGGRLMQASRRAYLAQRDLLVGACVAAREAGVSKLEIARQAGVTRKTLDKWLADI